MADMLSKAAAWLAAQNRSHAATKGVYARGVDSVTIPAKRGRTLVETPDASGVMVQVEVIDWIVHVDELALNGIPITPEAGDTFTVDSVVYEVLALPGLPPWRWADAHRQEYRIHTKSLD